jgi:hypothetical protein
MRRACPPSLQLRRRNPKQLSSATGARTAVLGTAMESPHEGLSIAKGRCTPL